MNLEQKAFPLFKKNLQPRSFLFADKKDLKERQYVANDAGGHDDKAVHGEGLA